MEVAAPADFAVEPPAALQQARAMHEGMSVLNGRLQACLTRLEQLVASSNQETRAPATDHMHSDQRAPDSPEGAQARKVAPTPATANINVSLRVDDSNLSNLVTLLTQLRTISDPQTLSDGAAVKLQALMTEVLQQLRLAPPHQAQDIPAWQPTNESNDLTAHNDYTGSKSPQCYTKDLHKHRRTTGGDSTGNTVPHSTASSRVVGVVTGQSRANSRRGTTESYVLAALSPHGSESHAPASMQLAAQLAEARVQRVMARMSRSESGAAGSCGSSAASAAGSSGSSRDTAGSCSSPPHDAPQHSVPIPDTTTHTQHAPMHPGGPSQPRSSVSVANTHANNWASPSRIPKPPSNHPSSHASVAVTPAAGPSRLPAFSPSRLAARPDGLAVAAGGGYAISAGSQCVPGSVAGLGAGANGGVEGQAREGERVSGPTDCGCSMLRAHSRRTTASAAASPAAATATPAADSPAHSSVSVSDSEAFKSCLPTQGGALPQGQDGYGTPAQYSSGLGPATGPWTAAQQRETAQAVSSLCDALSAALGMVPCGDESLSSWPSFLDPQQCQDVAATPRRTAGGASQAAHTPYSAAPAQASHTPCSLVEALRQQLSEDQGSLYEPVCSHVSSPHSQVSSPHSWVSSPASAGTEQAQHTPALPGVPGRGVTLESLVSETLNAHNSVEPPYSPHTQYAPPNRPTSIATPAATLPDSGEYVAAQHGKNAGGALLAGGDSSMGGLEGEGDRKQGLRGMLVLELLASRALQRSERAATNLPHLPRLPPPRLHASSPGAHRRTRTKSSVRSLPPPHPPLQAPHTVSACNSVPLPDGLSAPEAAPHGLAPTQTQGVLQGAQSVGVSEVRSGLQRPSAPTSEARSRQSVGVSEARGVQGVSEAHSGVSDSDTLQFAAILAEVVTDAVASAMSDQSHATLRQALGLVMSLHYAWQQPAAAQGLHTGRSGGSVAHTRVSRSCQTSVSHTQSPMAGVHMVSSSGVVPGLPMGGNALSGVHMGRDAVHLSLVRMGSSVADPHGLKHIGTSGVVSGADRPAPSVCGSEASTRRGSAVPSPTRTVLPDAAAHLIIHAPRRGQPTQAKHPHPHSSRKHTEDSGHMATTTISTSIPTVVDSVDRATASTVTRPPSMSGTAQRATASTITRPLGVQSRGSPAMSYHSQTSAQNHSPVSLVRRVSGASSMVGDTGRIGVSVGGVLGEGDVPGSVQQLRGVLQSCRIVAASLTPEKARLLERYGSPCVWKLINGMRRQTQESCGSPSSASESVTSSTEQILACLPSLCDTAVLRCVFTAWRGLRRGSPPPPCEEDSLTQLACRYPELAPVVTLVKQHPGQPTTHTATATTTAIAATSLCPGSHHAAGVASATPHTATTTTTTITATIARSQHMGVSAAGIKAAARSSTQEHYNVNRAPSTGLGDEKTAGGASQQAPVSHEVAGSKKHMERVDTVFASESVSGAVSHVITTPASTNVPVVVSGQRVVRGVSAVVHCPMTQLLEELTAAETD